MRELIVETIQKAIPDAEVFVESPDGVHFQAIVVSAEFDAMPLIRQHQRVLNALKSEFDSERVHALQLKTMTPAQYKAARS